MKNGVKVPTRAGFHVSHSEYLSSPTHEVVVYVHDVRNQKWFANGVVVQPSELPTDLWPMQLVQR